MIGCKLGIEASSSGSQASESIASKRRKGARRHLEIGDTGLFRREKGVLKKGNQSERKGVVCISSPFSDWLQGMRPFAIEFDALIKLEFGTSLSKASPPADSISKYPILGEREGGDDGHW
jgi:hypothetical protein